MWKLLIGVFIFLYGSSFSQNPKVIDSLLTKLKYTTVDSVKAAILNDLSWEYNKGDPRKAMLYADELLKFSEGIRYKWGIAAGYSDIAFCHEYLSNYPEALRYHLMSLRMAEAMGRKRLIARFYNNVASVYERVGEFDLSLRYYFKKLAIVEEKNFKNPEKLLASTYNNIGCVYRDKKQFDSALKYLYISNELTMKIGDSTTLANTYLNLGLVYGESGAYRMALQSFDKAARIAEKVRYDRAFPMIFNGTAAVYNKMKKPDQAVIFAHKGIEASRACGSRVAEFAAYENLVYAYNAKRDYEKKSEMQDRVMALKDSIFNAEKNEQLTNLRVQFETEETEKENTLLAEQNKVKDLQLSRNRYITWGLVAVVIFTILLAFLLFRQSRLKSQQKAIKLEQKLLRSQMNPHFIFNSLMAIESFIYTSEPREAGKYLSDFARLMRLILENSREESITLEKEIRTLTYYLQLQKLRYEDKFDYVLDVDKDVDPENVWLPPMLAQPVIENAIEHGIKHLENRMGQINISFTRKGQTLLLEVRDNGVGFGESANKKPKGVAHRSLSATITSERLAILNKGKTEKVNMTIEELKDSFGTVLGTSVLFHIPYKES